MRSIVLTGAVVVSLVCSTGAALAQKAGGVLKMYHRDNPPSLSIHEEATNSTVIPIMSEKLLEDGARPIIMWNRAAICMQPFLKGYVPQVNSVYNGFRFEDVWLDR